MKIIGLTGQSGAGKSSCCDFLTSYGFSCIDADKIYHDLINKPSPCTKELISTFGRSIENELGGIDRKTLAGIVFSDSTHHQADVLNKITHKYVRQETLRFLSFFQNRGDRATIIDAPLLFEANFDDLCDFCIAVIAPPNLRLERIMCRDHLSEQQALARLSAQNTDDYYTSRSKYTVINDSDKEKTNDALRYILEAEGLIP